MCKWSSNMTFFNSVTSKLYRCDLWYIRWYTIYISSSAITFYNIHSSYYLRLMELNGYVMTVFIRRNSYGKMDQTINCLPTGIGFCKELLADSFGQSVVIYHIVSMFNIVFNNKYFDYHRFEWLGSVYIITHFYYCYVLNSLALWRNDK